MKIRQIIFYASGISAVICVCLFITQSVTGMMFAREIEEILGVPIELNLKNDVSGEIDVSQDDVIYLRKAISVMPLCIKNEQRSFFMFVISIIVMWISRKENFHLSNNH